MAVSNKDTVLEKCKFSSDHGKQRAIPKEVATKAASSQSMNALIMHTFIKGTYYLLAQSAK